MNESKFRIAVTVQVGGVAFTVEMKKADPKEPPVKIEAIRNGGCLGYRKDEKK
jgi:hypothetical protein